MDLDLTPEPQAQAQRLCDLLQGASLPAARHRARLMASQPDPPRLGPHEFDLRDAAHRRAASALQAARNEREKGATAGRA
jgi:hypothetical protein